MSKKVATLQVASGKPEQSPPADAVQEAIAESIVDSQQMEGVPMTSKIARKAVKEVFSLPFREIS